MNFSPTEKQVPDRKDIPEIQYILDNTNQGRPKGWLRKLLYEDVDLSTRQTEQAKKLSGHLAILMSGVGVKPFAKPLSHCFGISETSVRAAAKEYAASFGVFQLPRAG